MSMGHAKQKAPQAQRAALPPGRQAPDAEMQQLNQMDLTQSLFGNQAVLRRIEAGLRIGDVNDPAEREADRVALAVASGRSASAGGVTLQPGLSTQSRTLIRRKCAACEHDDEAIPLRRKETGAEVSPHASPAVGQVLASAGQPLDPATRAQMQSEFKEDFSQVRVHTGAVAAESARAVGASAYTVGRDVVFSSGAYSPGTPAGTRLLAHELTHVVQQKNTGPALQRQTPEEQRKQEEDRKALELRARSLQPGQLIVAPGRPLEETLAAAGLGFGPAAEPAKPSRSSSSPLTAFQINSAIQAAQLLDIQNKLAQHGIGLNGPTPPVAQPAATPAVAPKITAPPFSPEWGPRFLGGFLSTISADNKLRAQIEKLKLQLDSNSGKTSFAVGVAVGVGSGGVTSILDMAYVPFKLYLEASSASEEEIKAAFEKFEGALLKAALLVLSSEPEAIGKIAAQLVSEQARKDIFFEEGRAPLQSPLDVVNGRPKFNLPSSLSDVATAVLSTGAPGEAGSHVYNKGLAMGQVAGSAVMNLILLFVGIEEVKGIAAGADTLRVIKESLVGKKLSTALEAIPEVQKLNAAKRLEGAGKVVQTAEKEAPVVAQDIAEVLEPTRHPKVGDIKARRPYGFWTEQDAARATPGRNITPGTLEDLEKPKDAPRPRGKSVTREEQIAGIDPRKQTNAQITRREFDTKLRDEWADRLGLRKGDVVDHARELQLLDLYPGAYTQDELNALKNMRGVKAEHNAALHLGRFRQFRNEVYEGLDFLLHERGLQPGSPEYKSAVRDVIERSVRVLDEDYAHLAPEYGKSLRP